MSSRRTQGGFVLVPVLVVILVMSALGAAYVSFSVSAADLNVRCENRYRARLAALSGVNRALVELNAGRAANIDGSANDPARITSGSTSDSWSLTRSSGSDGWNDFQDQSAACPSTPIARHRAGGSYSVRTRTAEEGGAWRVRSYGVQGREIAGVEAVLLVTPPPSLWNFAIYGTDSVTMTGRSGGVRLSTDSYATDYPPPAGTAYGPPGLDRYQSGNIRSNGDVGSNGPVTVGDHVDVNGTVTPNASASPAWPEIPARPTDAAAGYAPVYLGSTRIQYDPVNAGYDPSYDPAPSTSLARYPCLPNLKSSRRHFIGRSRPGVSGRVVLGDVDLADDTVGLTIYPASGQTLEIWVLGNKCRFGTGAIEIYQPIPYANGAVEPGTVKLYVPNARDVSIGQTGAVPSSDPPALFQVHVGSTPDFPIELRPTTFTSLVLSARNAAIHMSGSSNFFGAVWGKSVIVEERVRFHYDESLGNVAPPPGGRGTWSIASLVDVPTGAAAVER